MDKIEQNAEKIAEMIRKLREYNSWRRGSEEIEQPNPTEVGILIENLCETCESMQKTNDMAHSVYFTLEANLQSGLRKMLPWRNELYWRNQIKKQIESLRYIRKTYWNK